MCLQDNAYFKKYHSFFVDWQSNYTLPLYTQVLLKSLPSKLDFVFATETGDPRGSKIADIPLNTKELEKKNFAKIDVPRVGTVTLVVNKNGF